MSMDNEGERVEYMNKSKNCSVNNIYKLNGRVPLIKAIPFGLQHILAMFVANLTPIKIGRAHV